MRTKWFKHIAIQTVQEHLLIGSPTALLPKGPFRTKSGTESKFTPARTIRYGSSKTLHRVLISASFSGKTRQENGTDGKKTTAVAKINTTDSGAVLFSGVAPANQTKQRAKTKSS